MNRLLHGILCVLSIGIFGETLSMDLAKSMKNEEKPRGCFLYSFVRQDSATINEVKILIKRDGLRSLDVKLWHRYIGQSPANNWEGNHCGNKQVVNYLFNKLLIQKLNIVAQNRTMAEAYEQGKLRTKELSNGTKKRKTDTFVLDL